jgi:anti-sigma factor RsiW
MNENHVPDWKLEDYLLGELSPEEFEVIRGLEQSDDGVRERIEALRASNAEILAEYPPARMAGRLELRYSRVRGAARPRKRGGWPVSFFICAALLLVLPMLIILVPALIDTLETDGTCAIDETARETAVIPDLETRLDEAEDEAEARESDTTAHAENSVRTPVSDKD